MPKTLLKSLEGPGAKALPLFLGAGSANVGARARAPPGATSGAWSKVRVFFQGCLEGVEGLRNGEFAGLQLRDVYGFRGS